MTAPLPDDGPPAYQQCMANAARILRYAEGEMDLAKMDKYTELAQTWINLASLYQDAQT